MRKRLANTAAGVAALCAFPFVVLLLGRLAYWALVAFSAWLGFSIEEPSAAGVNVQGFFGGFIGLVVGLALFGAVLVALFPAQKEANDA